jgi:hypothetical protein
MTVTLDIVPGTLIDTPAGSTLLPKRFIRMAGIDGIDVSSITGSPKYEAMFVAQTQILNAAAASPITNHPEYVLMRIVIQPDPNSDSSATAQLIYETAQFGAGQPPSTFVITDKSALTTRQTHYIPGINRKQKISLAWEPHPDKPYEPGVPEDLVTISILFPMRVMTIDALIYGRPTEGQDFVGYVNGALWPTLPGGAFPNLIFEYGDATFPTASRLQKDKGFWLLTEYATQRSRYSGYFTLSAQAQSRVIEDWSECIQLRDKKTGRFVQISKTIDLGDAIIAALMAAPYQYGIVRGTPQPGNNDNMTRNVGVARVGPYPSTDFVQIFGF